MVDKCTNMNNQLSNIGTYDFLAEPFHCDFNGNLMMSHLGNHLLNAADYHSNERGYGMTQLNPIHKTWVLSRLAIQINSMPRVYDKLKVSTWVDSVMRYFTSRNFSFTSANGKLFGYARSIWAMIDTQTRQPVDILSLNDGGIAQYIETLKECPIAAPSRVKLTSRAQCLYSVKTTYSDIDMNGHINSVRYIEHLLNIWDTHWYATYAIHRIDIAYVAEAHGGDMLYFDVEHDTDNNYLVRISKQSEGRKEKVEVCRCKIQFTEIK